VQTQVVNGTPIEIAKPSPRRDHEPADGHAVRRSWGGVPPVVAKFLRGTRGGTATQPVTLAARGGLRPPGGSLL
jgi:hypothetical protein